MGASYYNGLRARKIEEKRWCTRTVQRILYFFPLRLLSVLGTFLRVPQDGLPKRLGSTWPPRRRKGDAACGLLLGWHVSFGEERKNKLSVGYDPTE